MIFKSKEQLLMHIQHDYNDDEFPMAISVLSSQDIQFLVDIYDLQGEITQEIIDKFVQAADDIMGQGSDDLNDRMYQWLLDNGFTDNNANIGG